MSDGFFMEIFNGIENLNEIKPALWLWELGLFNDSVIELSSFCEFSDNVEIRLCFLKIEQFDNVRMLEGFENG